MHIIYAPAHARNECQMVLYHYIKFSSCNSNLMLDAFVSLPRVLKLKIQPNIQFTTDGLSLTILWELVNSFASFQKGEE